MSTRGSPREQPGRSRAGKRPEPQTVPLTSIDADARTRLHAWLGRTLSAHDVRGLVGAPPGARVHVSVYDELHAAYGEGLKFTMTGPPVPVERERPNAAGEFTRQVVREPLFGGDALGAADRYLYRQDNGTLEMHNHTLRVLPEWQRHGVGLRIFAAEAKALSAAGVSRIVANMAGHKRSSDQGYWIWPLMGYNTQPSRLAHYREAMLRDKSVAKAERDRVRRLGPNLTVQDLYQTAAGRAWWREHGVAEEGIFDLAPGSRSMQVLRAYAESKGLRWEAL